MRFANTKIVMSGNLVECIQFERAIRYGSTRRKSSSVKTKRVGPTEISESSLRRSKTAIRRLVSANARIYTDSFGKLISPKFLTITFRKDVTSLDEAHAEFTLYIKRLNYWLLQFGSSDLRGVKTDQDVIGLINYVSKYVTKDMCDDRLIGRKHYFRSQGLERPKTFIQPDDVHAILESMLKDEIVYEKESTHEYYGKAHYTAFRLKGYNKIIDALQW